MENQQISLEDLNYFRVQLKLLLQFMLKDQPIERSTQYFALWALFKKILEEELFKLTDLPCQDTVKKIQEDH